MVQRRRGKAVRLSRSVVGALYLQARALRATAAAGWMRARRRATRQQSNLGFMYASGTGVLQTRAGGAVVSPRR